MVASVASAIFQLLMIRIAEFVLGPFNETFALVLTTVLLGLALGSVVVGRIGLSFTGALLLSLVGLVALLMGLPHVMRLYAALYPQASASYPLLVGLKLSLMLVLMGLPAVGFGATIPALLRTSGDDVARESGRLLFYSAVANAAGFLLMAAVLHQHLDYGWLLVVIAALTASAILLPSFRRGSAVAALALVAVAVSAQRTSWDEMLLYLSYTSFQSPKRLHEAQRERTFADRFKGPEDVFAISWIDGKPFFFINGYISVGLTSPAERVVGGLSAMLSPRLDRALVLGMGTGATAGVVAPVFAHTDVVEINRVVLDNLYRMAQYNLDIERRPGVRIIHDDGIHWIKTTSTQYSLILNTVTSPRYFSSSKLYTREFFAMVLRRLTPDGVYVTWLDGRIGDRGLDIILQSLRDAFARCWLSYLRSNYFFLACSNGQLGLHQFGPVAANPELRRYFADAFALPVRVLPYGVLSVDAFALQGVRPAPLNTLNFPVLEFEMARLGAATPLREFKRRLETRLDLAQVQAAVAPFGWNAAEFSVAAHLQLPPSSRSLAC